MNIRYPERSKHTLQEFIENEEFQDRIQKLETLVRLTVERLSQEFSEVDWVACRNETVVDFRSASDFNSPGDVYIPVVYTHKGVDQTACEIGIHVTSSRRKYGATIRRTDIGMRTYGTESHMTTGKLRDWIVANVRKIAALGHPIHNEKASE